jgi:tRNA 2-selenouridine synthase
MSLSGPLAAKANLCAGQGQDDSMQGNADNHRDNRSDQAGLGRLSDFDELIDARSPAEYAEDHVPGAVNLPVLDDAERARVGTLYKQESPFTAKKVGAALVSRNIAGHLDGYFAAKPKGYRPLVYCWRGGSRSGAMTHVLRSVGWQAAQLSGGYKAYRRQVIADLAAWPVAFRFVVVCGPTGVGKSRFLRMLGELGGQVLDLEDLAAHMGSVLGAYPTRPQPGQKQFESEIWWKLRGFSRQRPVFVESESRKIGNLHMPDALLARMRASECLTVTAAMPVRLALLKEEYAHFLADPERLAPQLDCLLPLKGEETIERWKGMAHRGDWDGLVTELLDTHYDPAYARSLGRNYPGAREGRTYRVDAPNLAHFRRIAGEILASLDGA